MLQPLGLSDHGVVVGDLVCEWKSKVVQKPRRLYHKGKYDCIVGLNLVDWDNIFESKSVQDCWDIFKTKIEELVEQFVPMSTPRDFNEPWMNGSLMRYWRKSILPGKDLQRESHTPGTWNIRGKLTG